MRHCIFTTLLLLLGAASMMAQGPLPSNKQLEWQKLETYAFIHFGQSTFSDLEWSYGDADPKNFNPSQLDCEQWVKVLKEGGMKAVILTTKHHDGFCLWPSKHTDYTIAASPYKNGRGDIVGELSAACRKYGLKFGIYLSPWDRHQSFYGTPAYLDYYKAQLKELLTQYGEIFEVWLDGANGGDGYYGGARETRKIDGRTYYHFDELYALIHTLQPNAVIFSDGGPGCRWVGNEDGIVGETNWSFLRSKDVYAGYPHAHELNTGHVDGDAWMPAECDVSIRPGWFYHAKEDNQVKTGQELFNLYLKSVGRNGSFLLNLPPTKEGLIHSIDAANIKEFNRLKEEAFRTNLLVGAQVKASSEASKTEEAQAVLSADSKDYWLAKDTDTTPELIVTLPQAQKMRYFELCEHIAAGQHVARFTVEYKSKGGEWLPLPTTEQTTTIGNRRILPFPEMEIKELRIRFLESRGRIYMNKIAAY